MSLHIWANTCERGGTRITGSSGSSSRVAALANVRQINPSKLPNAPRCEHGLWIGTPDRPTASSKLQKLAVPIGVQTRRLSTVGWMRAIRWVSPKARLCRNMPLTSTASRSGGPLRRPMIVLTPSRRRAILPVPVRSRCLEAPIACPKLEVFVHCQRRCGAIPSSAVNC